MPAHTAKYKQTVSVLKELLAKEGEESVNTAFAEATSETRAVSFANQFGVTPFHDPTHLPPECGSLIHVCTRRLLGKRCMKEKYESSTELVPASDHWSEWTKDGRTCAIISQPYGLSYDSLKRTVTFCEEHGLEASINAETAWHFPGKTLCIAYTKAGSEGIRLFQ